MSESKSAADSDDPRSPFARAPPGRGWHVIYINCRFALNCTVHARIAQFFVERYRNRGYKPVNMNRSYKYSLFFVGTVCKMYFTSVYPGIKDQEYGSTEKFKRTGMLLHKKTAHHKMGSLSDSDRIHSMQHHKITPKSYNIIYQ